MNFCQNHVRICTYNLYCIFDLGVSSVKIHSKNIYYGFLKIITYKTSYIELFYITIFSNVILYY